MTNNDQSEFKVICEKLGEVDKIWLERDYEWLGNVSDWLIFRNAMLADNVPINTILAINVLWNRHPDHQQVSNTAFELPPTTSLPMVNLTRPVTDVEPVKLSDNACQNLIGAVDTAEWIYTHIMNHITPKTDAYYRKTPILISRCPRGGKTTILELLHRLLKDRRVNVITVSFNGVSGFELVANETPNESLFRLITNQLDEAIGKQAPRLVNWDALDAHIGNHPFVLLIDELNVLCNTVGSDMAIVLKRYFIDKANRHLVFTSHQPFLVENFTTAVRGADRSVALTQHRVWSESVAALSDRSITLAPMPFCCDVPLLKNMKSKLCTRITYSLAAFYGYMPSLMYAVCVQNEESPAAKFNKVVPGNSNNWEQVLNFVIALITGIPSPDLQPFFCFSSAVEYDSSLGVKMRWPLCYILCIFKHFAGREIYESIANCIETLMMGCEKVGDGMTWEQSVRIAILLKFIAVSEKKWDPPFKLCEKEAAEGASVMMMNLGQGITSVEQAKEVIYNHKDEFQNNTLVLFVPTEAKFEQFDGFCVRYQDWEVRNVCGYQCKDNNKGAIGRVPEWITQGGHLLRSDAPMKCKSIGQNKANRWTYYDEKDTDNFLGWSLQIMRAKYFG